MRVRYALASSPIYGARLVEAGPAFSSTLSPVRKKGIRFMRLPCLSRFTAGILPQGCMESFDASGESSGLGGVVKSVL